MMKESSYKVFRAVVRPVFSLFFPLRASGMENVPQEGAVILCANHQSLTDPIALCCALKRRVRFMAKKEVFGIFGLKWLLNALGAFPVDRGAGDLGAIRGAMGILKDGDVLGIFPQGTRMWKEKKPFQGGVSLLAARSDAVVVPVYISDRARLFRPIRVVFGRPVPMEEFRGRVNSQALAQLTQTIEESVFGLGAGKAEENCKKSC